MVEQPVGVQVLVDAAEQRAVSIALTGAADAGDAVDDQARRLDESGRDQRASARVAAVTWQPGVATNGAPQFGAVQLGKPEDGCASSSG